MNYHNILRRLYESSMSSFRYTPPQDPEQLMYDFYFMASFVDPKAFNEGHPGDGEAAEYNIRTERDKLINYMQEHMLKVLKVALSAEIDHIRKPEIVRAPRKAPANVIEFYNAYKDLYPRSEKKGLKDAALQFHDDPMLRQNLPIKGKEYAEEDSPQAGILAYQTALRIQGLLGQPGDDQFTKDIELAKIFIYIYSKFRWEEGWGGEAWVNIAKAYYNLLLASSEEDKIVWIDHTYDLQHNSGVIFDRIAIYAKLEKSNDGENSWESFDWIQDALDWKKYINDYKDYYEVVSDSLKPLVAAIMYRHGESVEDIMWDPESTEQTPYQGGALFSYVRLKPQLKQLYFRKNIDVGMLKKKTGVIKGTKYMPPALEKMFPGGRLFFVKFPGISEEIPIISSEITFVESPTFHKGDVVTFIDPSQRHKNTDIPADAKMVVIRTSPQMDWGVVVFPDYPKSGEWDVSLLEIKATGEVDDRVFDKTAPFKEGDVVILKPEVIAQVQSEEQKEEDDFSWPTADNFTSVHNSPLDPPIPYKSKMVIKDVYTSERIVTVTFPDYPNITHWEFHFDAIQKYNSK